MRTRRKMGEVKKLLDDIRSLYDIHLIITSGLETDYIIEDLHKEYIRGNLDDCYNYLKGLKDGLEYGRS